MNHYILQNRNNLKICRKTKMFKVNILMMKKSILVLKERELLIRCKQKCHSQDKLSYKKTEIKKQLNYKNNMNKKDLIFFNQKITKVNI